MLKKKVRIRIPLPPKPGGPHEVKKRKRKVQQRETWRSIESGIEEYRRSRKGKA